MGYFGSVDVLSRIFCIDQIQQFIITTPHVKSVGFDLPEQLADFREVFLYKRDAITVFRI